jgi:hypothetical protein
MVTFVNFIIGLGCQFFNILRQLSNIFLSQFFGCPIFSSVITTIMIMTDLVKYEIDINK